MKKIAVVLLFQLLVAVAPAQAGVLDAVLDQSGKALGWLKSQITPKAADQINAGDVKISLHQVNRDLLTTIALDCTNMYGDYRTRPSGSEDAVAFSCDRPDGSLLVKGYLKSQQASAAVVNTVFDMKMTVAGEKRVISGNVTFDFSETPATPAF